MMQFAIGPAENEFSYICMRHFRMRLSILLCMTLRMCMMNSINVIFVRVISSGWQRTRGSTRVDFFPFCIWAMENLDLREYDVIVISTTFCAKYVRISPRALVIT